MRGTTRPNGPPFSPAVQMGSPPMDWTLESTVSKLRTALPGARHRAWTRAMRTARAVWAGGKARTRPRYRRLADRRRKFRPWFGFAFIASSVAFLTYYFLAIQSDANTGLWRLGGQRYQQIRDFDPPPDWRHLLTLDTWRIPLAVVTLALAALAFDAFRGPEHLWPVRTWHVLLTGGAIAVHGIADGWENWYVHRLLSHQARVTPEEARQLAWATNTKRAALALAVLLILAMWSRRPEHAGSVEPAKASWRDPARRDGAAANVTGPGDQWNPSEHRMGITVSGGGIRSAAFAFGALEALREHGLMRRARYVTSVSGGSYATSAFTALNQSAVPPGPAGTAGEDGEPFATGSAELQGVRRNLRYLISDGRVIASAVARIVLGLALNLALIYALLFAVARPVGWLIGSPGIHPELRLDGSSVSSTGPDPCGGKVWQTPTLAVSNEKWPISGKPELDAWEVNLGPVGACVNITGPRSEPVERTVSLAQVQSGVVSIVDGRLTVERQPTVVACVERAGTAETDPLLDPFATCPSPATEKPSVGGAPSAASVKRFDLVTVDQPTLSVKDGAVALGAEVPPRADLLTVEPPRVEPASVFSLRRHISIDGGDWLPGAALFALSVVVLAWRVTKRPSPHPQGLNRLAAGLAGLGLGLLGVFVFLPWLADEAPRWLVRAAHTNPSAGTMAKLSWLPGAGQLPVILVWPLLSIVSVARFFQGMKPPTNPSPSTAPNTRAWIKKYVALARQALVGAAVVLAAFVVAITAISSGALNGPFGRRPTFVHDLLGLDTHALTRPDYQAWFLVMAVLTVTSGWSESWAWSPGPIYRRRLADALYWQRLGDHKVEPFAYEPEQPWTHITPISYRDHFADDEDANREKERRDDTEPTAEKVGRWVQHATRAGYVDGGCGNGTELVLCCSANVLGSKRTPTGRSAMSFTASRSFIGSPEIGWLPTSHYVDRLSPRRRWDITLPGLTSLSGAAVATAMGKEALGFYGQVLAVLNLRLGAWLPNPAWIGVLGTDQRWKHNPSWPWYLREVTRRYGPDRPYYYVSDGGHWENLGLVEALRRGCANIVVISAAGDGELSNGTLADAVEIARTDLGVEIDLPEAWKTRPPVGGEPASTLPSGRQYVLEPGPTAKLGRAAPQGYAFGTIRFPDKTTGQILLIEATMVDELPVDVHAYAEAHPEFPNVSTGDQLFSDRDFEAYRTLGMTLVERALSSVKGHQFEASTASCHRLDPAGAEHTLAFLAAQVRSDGELSESMLSAAWTTYGATLMEAADASARRADRPDPRVEGRAPEELRAR